MHILLDHISAFIIGGIVLVSVLTMMHKNRQSTVEIQINQIVHEQAYEFLRIVERDLENIRSSSQAVLRGVPDTCGFQTITLGTLKRTQSLVFPTLEAPPNRPPELVSVIYRLEEDTSLDSVRVNDRNQKIYSVNRYRRANASAPEIPDGTSGPIITNFSVRMYDNDGVEALACPDDGDLGRTQVEFQAALPTVEYLDENQRSKTNLNVTRFGATVYSPNR